MLGLRPETLRVGVAYHCRREGLTGNTANQLPSPSSYNSRPQILNVDFSRLPADSGREQMLSSHGLSKKLPPKNKDRRLIFCELTTHSYSQIYISRGSSTSSRRRITQSSTPLRRAVTANYPTPQVNRLTKQIPIPITAHFISNRDGTPITICPMPCAMERRKTIRITERSLRNTNSSAQVRSIHSVQLLSFPNLSNH